MIDIDLLRKNLKDYRMSSESYIEEVQKTIKEREEVLELIKNFSPKTLELIKDLDNVGKLPSSYEYDVQRALIIDKHIKNLLFTKKLEEIIE